MIGISFAKSHAATYLRTNYGIHSLAILYVLHALAGQQPDHTGRCHALPNTCGRYAIACSNCNEHLRVSRQFKVAGTGRHCVGLRHTEGDR